MRVTHEGLAAFRGEVPVRRVSREREFGASWRDDYERAWRVSWVEDTGEVYAVALGDVSVARMGGHTVTFGGPDDTGAVALLAAGMTEAEVATRLEGWEEICGTRRSLDWVVDALDEAAVGDA